MNVIQLFYTMVAINNINTVSIEVYQPPDDSQVTLSISVDPEKQLHVILVPHTTTRHSSPVAPEFVMPFGSPTPKEDVEGQKGSEHPSSTTTSMPELVIDMNVPDEATTDMDMVSPSLLLNKCHWMVVAPLQWQEVWLTPRGRVNHHPSPSPLLN